MTTGEIEGFGWVRSTVLRDAACLTLVSPPDAGRVTRGFGGDIEATSRMPLAEAGGNPPTGEPVIAVRDLGAWLLVAEVNGWQGSRPEVLRRVSAGGRAVSCYWNVNGVTRFSYAVAGRLLTSFEAMSPGQRHGADPDALEEARSGLPWGSGQWVPLMLALAARVTGQRPGPDWLAGDFTVVPVTPVDDYPASAVYPPSQALTYDDGPLAWALVHADDASRRRVASIAARYAADEATRHYAREARGREDGPETRPGPKDRARAGRLFWVKDAAREASGPNSLAAAFKSATAAYTCLQALHLPDDELRAEMMAALGNPAPPAGSLGLSAQAGPAPTDRYLWTGTHWLAPGGAIRFMRGAGLDEAARALGADTGTARDGIPSLSRKAVAAFRRDGDWLVAVEGRKSPGFFRVLELMPTASIMISVTWTARTRVWVRYSRGGTLVDALDPQRPDQRLGEEPAFLNEYASGLPLPFPPQGDPATQLPVMLAIAERLTGLAFAPEWLDMPHVLMDIHG